MRIITVDNGNTNPHVGIFENDKLAGLIPLKDFTPLHDDYILISNVGRPLNFKPSFDLKAMHVNHFFFDMPVNYTETLGDDRLIAGYSAYKQLKPNESALVIDAGTFITIDLVNHTGFVGGYIFPGLSTFLSSYHKGFKLPLLEIKNDFLITELPHSTDEAILGAADIYIDSLLESTIKKTSPGKIVLTGGSLELIKNKISKLNLPKFLIETNRHLIHLSLFEIYQNHLRSA
jgi:type III pantothenate kinase